MRDVKWQNGDICLDSAGRAEVLSAHDAEFQRALIRMTARRGSFIYDRELGADCGGISGELILKKYDQAFAEALGDKRGIARYGDIALPMDEALILAAVDLSGRDYLSFALEIPTEKIGTFDTELVEEFWLGFVRNAGCTLHIRQLSGKNAHHIVEGAFKATARAFRAAVKTDGSDAVPSTKGVL